MDWISFWNSDHPIYVNARHRDVHYRGIADDVSGYVPPGAAVLDYGCGESLHADRVAAKAGRLILCEAASNVREHLASRFGGGSQYRGEVAGRSRGAAGGLARPHRHAFGRAISQPGTRPMRSSRSSSGC